MTYSMLLSSHKLLKVLYWIAVLAVFTAMWKPGLVGGIYDAIARRLRELSGSRWRAMMFAAAFPMIVRAVMLPWFPPPTPQIHDEFSYLLQADTFAHGRVANPTPPYWQHFESEYVLLQPVYASQYQPAQGIALAVGEVVFKHPWFGVWLSMGAMNAALFWALSLIFPPGWALFGAIAAALQFGIFGLWMNSYFGGAIAAAAGAIIAGSIARMRRPGLARGSAALAAFGIVVLFASRPVEAVLWSILALISTVLSLPLRGSRPKLRTVLPPFAAVFIAGASLLAFYNWRVTGNPADPPYLAYQRIYGTPQPFWWQAPHYVSRFDFAAIRDNYLNQLHLYESRYSIGSIAAAEGRRLRDFWRFFIGPFYTPALLFLPLIFRDRRIRPWLWASVPFIVDKATYHAWFPAQNAPATILILIVVVQCWRHMYVWWRTRRVGVALSRQLVAASCLAVMLGGIGRAAEPVLPAFMRHLPAVWESLYPARRLRDEVNAKLEQVPGKHLVFVKYSEDHCFCEEWVFNSADIDSQRIVYVRPYTPESDEALARYLRDRDIWIVEPDEQPYRLTRVTSSSTLATIETRGFGHGGS